MQSAAMASLTILYDGGCPLCLREVTFLRQRGDMAILLVEQYLDFAHELADDFAVMDRGEIVMSGTRETFDVEKVRGHMTV